MRSNYTWHLRPPFSEDFDRTQWWTKSSKAAHPVAALYELARRHPRIGDLRTKFRSQKWHGMELRLPKNKAEQDAMVDSAFADLGREPKAIHCLCLIGLKSWPQLDARDQEYWIMSAERLKGVDCRDEIEQWASITELALSELLKRRMAELNPPKGAMQFLVPVSSLAPSQGEARLANPEAHQRGQELLTASLKGKPLTQAQMEEAVARHAVDAYREGNFLFSVAPDLTQQRAEEVLARAYREHQRSEYGEQSRARSSDWLPAISAFEHGEVELGGAKSGDFIRYRRILEGFEFQPPESLTMKLTRGT